MASSVEASPSTSGAPTIPSNSLPGMAPDYRDPEIPQIQSLNTSSSKDGNVFTLVVQLDVKIHRNILSSIEINFLPKTIGANTNPKLLPPCVKLGSIKAPASKPGESMTTLQSRTASGDWYIESHTISYKVNLPPVQYATSTPTFQDICDGQYVLSTIILKDAANHTLTITSNAASTAPIVSNSGISSNNNSATKSKYNDNAIMQADFWIDSYSMPCTPGNNLAPTTTNQVINGKTVPVTSTPSMSATFRVPCNQSLDFNKSYLSIVGSGSVNTSINGTSAMPIIDYASQIQALLNENQKLKNEIDALNKKLNATKKKPKSKSKNTNLNPRVSPMPTQSANSRPSARPAPKNSPGSWRTRMNGSNGWKYTPRPTQTSKNLAPSTGASQR